MFVVVKRSPVTKVLKKVLSSQLIQAANTFDNTKGTLPPRIMEVANEFPQDLFRFFVFQ